MTMLYPTEVLMLNTYPYPGYPKQNVWVDFDNGDPFDEIRTMSHVCSVCPRRNAVFTKLRKYKLSSSDEELAMNRRRDLPASILKRSFSADTIILNHFKTTTRFKSTPSLHTAEEPLTPPKSPKNVTFADDNNLSLVQIRNFIPSDENVNLWQNFHGKLKLEKSEHEDSLALRTIELKRKPVELKLCFHDPSDDPEFLERFKHRCVALEKCATRDRTLTGIIIVKNIEYNKEIFVRYTTDCWKSSDDTEACYVPNSNDGETDRFMFSLTLPKNTKELEFAICYKTSINEFWDSNYNRNYKVQDALLAGTT